jgi:phosphoribosyl-AMP cyclohydrolase
MSSTNPPSPAPTNDPDPFADIAWDADGLVPAIVQDAVSGEVLMLAWMNREALRLTLTTGETHFYSRSRKKLWRKGETSGHAQQVESVFVDCDADVILVKAHQTAGACHLGYRSCFFRQLDANGTLQVIARPVFDAEHVYRAND